MKLIDPTYLRTIYDGLFSETIHKDNMAALPVGLTGIYEDALPPESNLQERKKFLEFFTVWALLKKEVSISFVLPLLESWTEEQVSECIAQYSKWFNSPVSGKYILYHERLRTFLLQKISHQQFTVFNEKIIKHSQFALQNKANNEWEHYALEYISTHLLIPAIQKGDGTELKSLSYNTAHWNRQVEISKGFDWSKRMLNDMMLWASKYDDEEVIECALNKVDLHHLEQNDAPRIVELVANNDMDTALQRIEAFGGNDKEGLQRKFIMYMLCLMELTLLESKDKPFRKEAIEKLLKHLDDNLPVDYSVLNWDDFFPSYLMFQMACVCADFGADYLVLYRRTKSFNCEWVIEKSNIVITHINTIINIANEIQDTYENALMLCNIIFCVKNKPLFKNLVKTTLAKIEQIEARHFKDVVKSKFAEVLILCDKIHLAKSVVSNIESHYLNNYFRILSQYYISRNDILSGLQVFERIEFDTDKIEFKAKSIIYFIAEDENSHADYLLEGCISSYLNIDEDSRGEVLSTFFSILMKCKRFETAIEFANDLYYEHDIDAAYSVIVSELLISNEIDKAILLIDKIKGFKERSRCFARIFKFFFLNGNQLNSSIYWDLALREVISLEPIGRDDWGMEFSPRCEALEDIAIELLHLDEKHFNVIMQHIKEVKSPNESLTKILLHPKVNEDLNKLKKCLLELSYFKQEFSHYSIYINLCNQIARIFLNKKRPDYALKVLNFIQSKHEFDKVLDDLVQLCISKNDIDTALILAKQFAFVPYICQNLMKISDILYAISNTVKAGSLLEMAKEYVCKIDFNQNLQQEYLFELTRRYLNLGKESECLLVISSMSDDFIHKGRAIINFSLFYVKRSKIEEALNYLEKWSYLGKLDKSRAIKEIAIEYAKINPTYSLELTKLIFSKSDRLEAQLKILYEFKSNEELLIARKLSKECIESVSSIKDDRDKSLLTKELVLFLAKIGEWRFAIEYCDNISLEYSHTKSEAVLSIIIELLNQNKINESLHLISKIDNHIDSNFLGEFYIQIGLELVKRKFLKEFISILKIIQVLNGGESLKALAKGLLEMKKIPEALHVASVVPNVSERIQIHLFVSNEFTSQGKSSDALNYILKILEQVSLIDDAEKKSIILSRISNELASLENYRFAEKIGWEISKIFERNACWKEIAEIAKRLVGWKQALKESTTFENSETKKVYLESLADLVPISECNEEVILSVRRYYLEDVESLEKLLQQYALHELFFNEASQKKIDRINRTLNIQWAIDIKNKLN